MNIVHINTNDVVGGAARAAHRLHEGLREIGQDSKMFVSRKSIKDQTVLQFVRPRSVASQAYRFLRGMRFELEKYPYRNTRPDGYEPFTNDKDRLGHQPLKQLPLADIIHLHWISSFIDYKSFFSVAPRASKIVWTLHDMNALTGGCHCNLDCNRYLDQCGSCPQLGSDNDQDLSNKIWNRKRKIFSSIDPSSMIMIAPSKWMRSEVQRSPLLSRFSVSTIPNSLDVEVFRPRDKKVSREFLGIDQNAKVILFVADSVTCLWKGFKKLDAALQGLKYNQNLILLSVGRNKPEIRSNHRHVHLGFVDNDRWLSQIYSAADIFVIPSLQETFGNTALESISCGVPVVGFDVGGIPDIVQPGKTGLLAKLSDIGELQRGIQLLLDKPELCREMSLNCRTVAVKEYNMKKQAKKYCEIYQQLL